ncbi:MAG: ABC transporter permease [Armatimonadota bacterium]|nr:ABC transporter permease [Armatimonadota bacterium]
MRSSIREFAISSASRQPERVAVGRLLVRRFRRNRLSMLGLAILLVWIVLALAAPLISPYDPVEVHLDARMLPPARGHWLGTDFYGRDILSRILHGARYDLLIALFAVGVAAGVGAPLGILAGYVGGRLDDLIMRVMDIIIAFPGLVLAMALASVLGPGLEKAILALAVVGVAGYARIGRASTLSVREETYVEAAQALGASDAGILAKHIAPNVISPVVVRATLGMGFTVLLAASLSFIGLGAQPPTPEWGAMINEGRNQLITGRWWVSTFPGLAIMSLVLGFNLLGDGIRDVLDPRGIVRM